MRRMAAIVRRLYAEELKFAADKPRRADGRWPRVKRSLSGLKKVLSRRGVVWVVRVAIVLGGLFLIVETVFQFNRLASWNTTVLAREADVDRELKRRENLLPNMVRAVSEYASYEQGVFKYVADAREALKMIRGGDVPKTKINSMLEQLLPRLVALAEEYPELKTAGAIRDLIAETANTENRIAEAKKEYNKASEVYNQYQTIFPGNFFASVFRFDLAPYMGLDENAEAPVIDLNVAEGGAHAAEG